MLEKNSHKFVAAVLDINTHTFPGAGEDSRSSALQEWLTRYHYIPSGLHYNLFRYYDPTGGLRIGPDRAGGGINLYQYAPNALS
jgi:RHS repeat-associated protein